MASRQPDIASCPQSVRVKKVRRSAYRSTWRRYRQSQSGSFFETQCE